MIEAKIEMPVTSSEERGPLEVLSHHLEVPEVELEAGDGPLRRDALSSSDDRFVRNRRHRIARLIRRWSIGLVKNRTGNSS